MVIPPIDPFSRSSKLAQPSEGAPPKSFLKGRELVSWQCLVLSGAGIVVAVGVSVVAGMMAVQNLLQVAASPDCRANLSAEETLSARIYCADELARNRTVEGLRDAIKLASSIPAEAPLRAMGDRRIEQWSRDLLDLGETAFQEGDLDRAIAIVRTIPMSSPVYPTGSDRIDQWKKTWEKAEDIVRETKASITRQEWTTALNRARELVRLGNRYWETSRYQDLLDEVQSGKEQQNAEKAAAEKVRASRVVQRFNRWEREFEAEAAVRLNRAKTLARSGNLQGLKAAIAEAQQIYYGTPVYEEAQQQIQTWQQQAETIQDRYHLDRAIRLASRGNEDSLQAAIDEAFMVSPTGKLYEEARTRVDQWMDRLYRIRYPLPASAESRRGDFYTIPPSQPTLTPNPER